MKTRSILCVMALTVAMSAPFAAGDPLVAGNGGSNQNQNYKRVVNYVDDAKITASVKSEIFKDPLLSGFKIGVQTKNGKVHLSGKTNTVLQFQRAISTAAKQKGVKLVIADNLKVKDEVTPYADLVISSLGNAEIEMYNELHPNNPIDMSHIEAEVHDKKIYIHGTAKSEKQKQIIIAIMESIDGNDGVYSAVHARKS